MISSLARAAPPALRLAAGATGPNRVLGLPGLDLFASDFGVPQRRRRLIAIALRTPVRGVLPADVRTMLPESFAVAPPDAGDVIDLAGPIGETTDALHRARTPTPLVLERIRAISLREAALLQTFPPDYRSVGSHGSIERQIGNAVPVRLAEVLAVAVGGALRGSGAPAPHERRDRAGAQVPRHRRLAEGLEAPTTEEAWITVQRAVANPDPRTTSPLKSEEASVRRDGTDPGVGVYYCGLSVCTPAI